MQEVDPRVCQRCGKEHNATLPTISTLHVCSDCAAIMTDYPFPRWVKWSAAGLLALVLFSAVGNARFVRAVFESRGAMAALHQGEWRKAEELARAAAAHVPEDPSLGVLADYVNGVAALYEGRYEEAVAGLQAADEVLHENFGTWLMLRQALIGRAFDNADYDTFLMVSREIAERYPEAEFAQMGVASAYACQYAISGDEGLRAQALQWLDKARSMPPENAAASAEYEQRIMHRLDTREIISRDEFLRRFPGGWPEEKEALK